MDWIAKLADIEELEDANLDKSLIARFENASLATMGRPIRFSTPTFKEYQTEP